MYEVTIAIPDEMYTAAKERASEEGFDSTDNYLSDLLLNSIPGGSENYDRLFTPKVLAAIERGAQDARDGKSMTRDELDAFLAVKRKEWIESH